jgi:hypothetical protein
MCSSLFFFSLSLLVIVVPPGQATKMMALIGSWLATRYLIAKRQPMEWQIKMESGIIWYIYWLSTSFRDCGVACSARGKEG